MHDSYLWVIPAYKNSAGYSKHPAGSLIRILTSCERGRTIYSRGILFTAGKGSEDDGFARYGRGDDR
ncbi:MAG TPA: hypothetical protein VKO45_00010, partial [Methanomicrobiales archaeon]|nr:hypothetical protein [Methanomicrobiales archaeon]